MRTAFIAVETTSTTSSYMDRGASTRVSALHTCPVFGEHALDNSRSEDLEVDVIEKEGCRLASELQCDALELGAAHACDLPTSS